MRVLPFHASDSVMQFAAGQAEGEDDMLTKLYPMVQFKKDTWEIDEFDVASMFLLVGEEKAMLIDCGTGIGDLRGAVEQITDKPLITVITHGHGDHVGNVRQFGEIWINPKDGGQAMPGDTRCRKEAAFRIAVRQHGGIGSGMYEAFNLYGYDPDTDIVESTEPMPVIHDLYDGQVFDLGGRIVTAYECPGHTAGQMMFLDTFSRSLFVGDALNFNLDIRAVPVEKTVTYLEHMQAMRGKYDGIYNGHHDFRAQGAPLGEDCLPNAIDLCHEILEGAYNLVTVPSFRGPASGRSTQSMVLKERNFLSFNPDRIYTEI